jgi:hypothetical protein
MAENKKMVMVQAGSLAFSYKRRNPNAEAEELIRYVMTELGSKKENKVFGIAAADYVLKYLTKKPASSEKEVMQSLVNQTPTILGNIEGEFE